MAVFHCFLDNWLIQDLSTFRGQNVDILLLLDFSALIRNVTDCSIALVLMFAFSLPSNVVKT